jgi:hypothetical protein
MPDHLCNLAIAPSLSPGDLEERVPDLELKRGPPQRQFGPQGRFCLAAANAQKPSEVPSRHLTNRTEGPIDFAALPSTKAEPCEFISNKTHDPRPQRTFKPGDFEAFSRTHIQSLMHGFDISV